MRASRIETGLPRQKSTNILALIQGLPLSLLAISLPAAWILASPPFSPAFRASQKTGLRLQANVKVLKSMHSRNKAWPMDLAEIRSYARSKKMNFKARDGWGEPFSYLRLSASHYVLRSFGKDGRPAALSGELDPSASHIGTWYKPRALRYNYPRSTRLDLFPAALLVSSASPQNSLRAKLFIDQESGTRHLLVVDRKKVERVMIAPHDRVEEFLWLPDGKRIVYTATGSPRYRDGIFEWNLLKNRTRNLIDSVIGGGRISPASRSDPLWISLAGVRSRGPKVHAYVALRNQGVLDPEIFFSRQQLVTFIVPPNSPPRIVKSGPIEGDPPVIGPMDLAQRIHRPAQSHGTGLQRRWLRLGFVGEVEATLTGWQNFTNNEKISPLFPYALWYLSSLYGESFSVMSKTPDSKTSEVLRSYGIEVAKALINYSATPTYLRGLANYTYESLMSGRPLAYGFGGISQKDFDSATKPTRPNRRQESTKEGSK